MISCLMVTRDRVSLARRAIRSYADQTYPNRELVIVTDGTERYRASLDRYASFIDAKNVRFADPGRPGQTLGALRNLSMDVAKGELVCQWDDDDCSHPERLSSQAAHMLREGALASFMTEHLQFMADDGTLCWIDWTLGGQGRGKDFVAPGTLLMARDSQFRYPEAGPRARRGEDSVFLERLHASLPVTHFAGAGHLFLYQYHGRNTFSRAHHRALGDYRRTTIAHLQAHEAELRTAAAYYGFAAPVAVLGREGPAFSLYL
jgi:glycosyltransferase involved in cell wall biosynthesis